ncbi:MAG: molecular chaperone TorD family protein [Thermodesulfobacteriota bacterium]|nr:molecular chaperone TorD family protein [Thermodesulfobacteriota bacterium]
MISFPERQRQTLLTAIKSMCRIFWGPDDRFCESVQKGSFLIPFEVLSTWVAYSPPDIIDKIRDVVDHYADAPSFCSDLEDIYVRLFISTRGGIAAPLYQSCYEYENASLMGTPADDMQKRFESKGLSLAENMNEPPDHLSIELEYLYFLLKTGWAGENRALLDEAASFAADILMPWLSRFSERLSADTNGHFYSLMTSLLMSILITIQSDGVGR